MQNIKWLFFDLGSTLIDETECIKKRCDVICKSNNIDREKFISKVTECAKIDSYAVKATANIYAHELFENGIEFCDCSGCTAGKIVLDNKELFLK